MSTTPPTLKPHTVIVYIDGFNLYHGIKRTGQLDLLWLDLTKFAEDLVGSLDTLVSVRYFTAPGRGRPQSERRQSEWLDANRAVGPGLSIEFGYFKPGLGECRRCGHTWNADEEKLTDVKIACRMLEDAFTSRCTKMIVVSGDSDLVPPIESVQRLSGVYVSVAQPPASGNSRALQQQANRRVHLKPQRLRRCQLADSIQIPSGVTIQRPAKWK